MASSFQAQTLLLMRHSIGRNLGIVIIGSATTTVDTSSLIDTKNLLGADDDHNGKETRIYDAAGSIVDGENSIVNDFTSSTNDATMSPVFTASITNGDLYEMWKHPWRIADINDAINQAINEVTNKALKVKETHTTFSESGKYLYDVLSGFTHLSLVEYVHSVGTQKTIHNCDAIFAELVDADVTASVDTEFKKEGSGSLKLVAVAGLGAGDIMATEDITSLDLSGCTELQIWIHSSVALSAGDLQVLLDNTASCASPVESLNIPATTANTWTRHIISLANPYNDAAIISVGIKQVNDKGAFTLRVDDIQAQDALSKEYRELPMEYWGVAKGATPYLELTVNGLNTAGTNTQMRLTGWQIPARLDADATESDIDPAYIIAKATGRLLIAHAKSAYLDIHDRQALSQYWLGEAAKKEGGLTPTLTGSTRKVS